MDPGYQKAFDGVLTFSDLSAADQCLRSLQKLRREFHETGDRKGEDYCRKFGLLGRKRAEFIARNRRVSAAKRREKAEIAEWFRVWLETPDLFEDWLALRKRSPDFLALVASREHESGPDPAP